MKKITLVFGLIAGGILAVMMAISIPLTATGKLDFERSEIIGYSSMILAFILIFFGIRSYRENVGGGSITFGRGFLVGTLITLVASVIYVGAWQIIYYGFFPDFEETYAAHEIAKMRAEGATPVAIAETEKKMETFKKIYKNPVFLVLLTFMEIVPVGLVVALVSAAILRKRAPARS